MEIELPDIAITLTQGFETYIDKEDWPLVAGRKWRVKRNGRTNYAISDSKGKREWMHKLILGTDERVDHRDDDGLNNRRSNLRILDNTNNIRRKRSNLNATSKFKGVSRFRDRWQASIKVDGKSIWIGSFIDERSAALAYNSAAKLHFGEHARINSIP